MRSKYERTTYQFLSFYRFFSFALAAVFMQFPLPLAGPQMPDEQIYIVLGVLGVYTILKVFSRLRWRERGLSTYVILIGDFLLCMVLVAFTNGLNSSFLLYSLTPIMTAALLFEEKVALSLAAAASISLSITHLAFSQFSNRFVWIMQGHNLTLLIIYTFFSFIAASVPYRTNLNIRRRIESEAIIEERRRIGREIHDSVAQSLSYLNLKTKMVSNSLTAHNTAQATGELNEIRRVVMNTYEDVREAIDQMSAESKNLPLTRALSSYVKRFSQQCGIQVNFDVPRVFPQLSPVAELQLLRIAQEALTNVRRHALATEVAIELTDNSHAVLMVIKDNGQGFTMVETDSTSDPSGYHGLSIMKERTEGIGGKLDIATAPGKGTEIRVSLPIEKVRL